MILKFILVAAGVLWLLSKLMKFAFRYLLLFTGQKLQKEMEKQMRYQQEQQQSRQHVHENGTRIIYEQKQEQAKTKRPSKDDGEFVDFEIVE